MNISIKKRSKHTLVLILLAIMVTFFSLNVSADFGTHVNVTITEQIYQETSFAENFTLDEWQKTCYSEGTINISNPQSETVYNIYISFQNTSNLQDNFTFDTNTKFGNQTSGQPGQTIVIHIPELRQNNYSVFTYNITCKGLNPQIDINSTYANTDHGYNRKVLAGNNWTIEQSIENKNNAGLNITNINVTITAMNVTWNDTQYAFDLVNLYNFGDYLNVTGNGTSTIQWWWTPNGGELSPGQDVSIKYNITAPMSVPFTATYQALQETIEYEVEELLSGMTLKGINASARVDFDFEKRISQPADNQESHNVTWEITPTVTVPVNITYNLNQVSLWVTETQDPTNDTSGTIWGKLGYNYSGTPLLEINMTDGGWAGASWYFNYTDGTNSTYPPPIVWMKPQYLLANKWGQIVNYTKSIAGNDIYTKYIYVVHGYWLEVEKNVTNIGEDQYQIYIYVENIGNGWTPEYEKVTVFDFVPFDFSVGNMAPAAYRCPSGTYCTNQSIGTVGDEYYGMSYKWDINWKGTMNSSLGPKNGPDAVTWQNYSWNVTYIVNGTGSYKVTDLYIVGLDPLKVDGAFASPIITIISSIQSYTNEIIYLSVIIFLIIVNITNLIMTNRIHSKIQQRLPAAPPRQPHYRPPMQ